VSSVVINFESLAAAIPSVELDLGGEIVTDAGDVEFSIIVAQFTAGFGNRLFSRIADSIDGKVIGGKFHIFLLANSRRNGKYIGRPIIADATGQGGNPARDASRF
jgi:hypothetical protein